MVCLSNHKYFCNEFYMQYINSPSLSEKESVILSTVIPAHASWKQEEINKRDSFARWALDAALIGKMAKLGGGIVCENGIDDCMDG